MATSINSKIKALPKASQAKVAKRSEELVFRAEVQKYLETGQSSLLTTKEKAKLDVARVRTPQAKPSLLDQLLAWFKN